MIEKRILMKVLTLCMEYENKSEELHGMPPVFYYITIRPSTKSSVFEFPFAHVEHLVLNDRVMFYVWFKDGV